MRDQSSTRGRSRWTGRSRDGMADAKKFLSKKWRKWGGLRSSVIVQRSWICVSFLIIASTFAVAPPEKPLWASWAAHLCVMTVSAAVSPGWIV